MHRIFIALALAALVAGPAAATDKADVMAVVHHWVDSFNQGDMKSMAAVCADEMSIIDYFPPHVWHGAGACEQWSTDFQAFIRAGGVTEPAVTVGKPWHVDVTSGYAYVAAPASFSFKQKGKAVKQSAVLTVTLQKSGADWHMIGWAWADR
jgi:ketosteroid isomerase-like protein